jgi:hypothetical protein
MPAPTSLPLAQRQLIRDVILTFAKVSEKTPAPECRSYILLIATNH